MNCLFDVYVAFLEQRNIFQEVSNFQKTDSSSENFMEVMEWLWDLVDVSNFACKSKVDADITIKHGNATVKVKATTEYLKCYIYEWHREKQE